MRNTEKVNKARKLCNEGYLWIARGQIELAIEDLKRAILLDPNSAVAYYYRSLSYFLKGDMKKSLSDARKANKLDPNDTSYREFIQNIEIRMNLEITDDQMNVSCQQKPIRSNNEADERRANIIYGKYTHDLIDAGTSDILEHATHKLKGPSNKHTLYEIFMEMKSQQIIPGDEFRQLHRIHNRSYCDDDFNVEAEYYLLPSGIKEVLNYFVAKGKIPKDGSMQFRVNCLNLKEQKDFFRSLEIFLLIKYENGKLQGTQQDMTQLWHEYRRHIDSVNDNHYSSIINKILEDNILIQLARTPKKNTHYKSRQKEARELLLKSREMRRSMGRCRSNSGMVYSKAVKNALIIHSDDD